MGRKEIEVKAQATEKVKKKELVNEQGAGSQEKSKRKSPPNRERQ